MNDSDTKKVEVQQATDIVALVGEHVVLRPRGKEFLGLCPFHDDKKPSLHVSPVKQIYKCFSCGAGGDVFSFMMQFHKMTFPEGLRHLAERAGIELPRRTGRGGPSSSGDSADPSERQLLSEANARAAAFFGANLSDPAGGRIAREYLSNRGISPEMVQAFQIGCAPDSWDALVRLIGQKGWNLGAFERAGLISPRSEGRQGHFDRLRHRLIFPICDSLGRAIAFGGRVLPDGTLGDPSDAKYLNSPETALFNKSSTLFGLHLAKKSIIDSHTAVVVEGYTDVVSCHQAGLGQVVATLGTALTAGHVAMLRRFADRVILIFDADAAGQKAADRAVEVFLTESLDVAVAVLPDGLDPADLLARPEGEALWHQAIQSAPDALTYLLKRLGEQLEASDTVTGRQRLAETFLRTIAGLGMHKADSIRRALVIQRIADLLHMRESEVDSTLKRLVPRAPRPSAPFAGVAPIGPDAEAATGSGTPIEGPEENLSDKQKFALASTVSAHRIKSLRLAECQVIGCLLHRSELFHAPLADGRTLDEAIMPADMLTAESRRLYQRIHDCLSDQAELTLVGLLGQLAAEGEQKLANLATQAEAEIEQSTEGHAERIEQTLVAASNWIVAHHQEIDYQQDRHAVMSAQITGDGADQDHRIRRLLEHRRSNPSPARIARVQN